MQRRRARARPLVRAGALTARHALRSDVVWDGHELLELGGTAGGHLGGAPSDTGAAYNPTDHEWRRVTSVPPAVLPASTASVWTGRPVFIFGGPTLPTQTATDLAWLYDPATNRWTMTSKAPVGPFNAPHRGLDRPARDSRRYDTRKPKAGARQL
jgi:hypothetical protein